MLIETGQYDDEINDYAGRVYDDGFFRETIDWWRLSRVCGPWSEWTTIRTLRNGYHDQQRSRLITKQNNFFTKTVTTHVQEQYVNTEGKTVFLFNSRPKSSTCLTTASKALLGIGIVGVVGTAAYFIADACGAFDD